MKMGVDPGPGSEPGPGAGADGAGGQAGHKAPRGAPLRGSRKFVCPRALEQPRGAAPNVVAPLRGELHRYLDEQGGWPERTCACYMPLLRVLPKCRGESGADRIDRAHEHMIIKEGQSPHCAAFWPRAVECRHGGCGPRHFVLPQRHEHPVRTTMLAQRRRTPPTACLLCSAMGFSAFLLFRNQK